MARGTLPTRSTKKRGTAGDGTAGTPPPGATARSRLRAARAGGERACSAEPDVAFTDEPQIPEHVARFFAALPTTTHPMQWILQFRKALLILFAEVDRIPIAVDVNNDNHGKVELVEIIQSLSQRRRSRGIDTTVETRKSGPQYEAFVRRMVADGESFEIYHPPVGIDLFLGEGRYLASIVLLRDCMRPPISSDAIAQMETLRPFLTYAISSMVAAFTHAHPAKYLFNVLCRRITKDARLTARELSVVTLQYFGYTYEQIAVMLHISPNTVKQRIKSVHRKTGCTTYLELFGRHVAPELLAAEEAGPERERVVTVM